MTTIELGAVTVSPPAPRTVVPDRVEVDERPKAVALRQPEDLLPFVGGAIAAFSLTALIFGHVAPFSGLIGFVAVAFPIFVGIVALLTSFTEPTRIVADRVAAIVVHALAALVLTALGFVIVYTFVQGRRALVHRNFFTEDLSNAGPLQPLTEGGVSHAIAGTLIEIAIALCIVVPLGGLCAVYLTEFPGRPARFVRTIVEAMTALPSIVAGLFIYATVILALHVEKSGLAAALAISVMMLPIVIRASDVVLRLVPRPLKEASYALGASRWATVRTVVLPTARSGLTTSVILGAARGLGETSPVLLTAGYGSVLNTDPLHGPMTSLPLAVFQLVKSPQPTQIDRGFGAAVVLLLVVLVLFVVARTLGGRPAGVLSPRQERRAAVRSVARQGRIQKRQEASVA